MRAWVHLAVRFFETTLTVAASGGTKTWWTLFKLVVLALWGQTAIIVFDKHGHLSRLIAYYAYVFGFTGRILYDQAGEFRRVLAGLTVEQSSDPCPFKREGQNHQRVLAIMNIIWRASMRNAEQVLETLAMLRMYLPLAIRLVLFQRKTKPLKALAWAVRIGTRKCRLLIDNCTDPEARWEWEYLWQLWESRSHRQLEEKIGSLRRLIFQVFSEPAFRERCTGKLDIDAIIHRKMIVIIDGSGDAISPEGFSALCTAWNLLIIVAQQRYFALAHQERKCLVIWEEAPALKILGPMEVNLCFREGRKTGTRYWVLAQDVYAWTPEEKASAKTNAPRHEWGYIDDKDLAQEAAEDIAYHCLSPDIVEHEQVVTRQFHGGFKTQKRITKNTGSTYDKDCNRTASTRGENESETLIPEYYTLPDIRKEFRSSDDQVNYKIQSIMNQGRGFWTIKHRTPRGTEVEGPVYMPQLQDPYPERDFPGFREKITDDVIRMSQQSPYFTTPVLEEEWNEQMTNGQTTTPNNASRTNGRVNGTTGDRPVRPGMR